MRLEDIEYERWFDGVWACASLLHFPKSRVALVLRRLRQALKDEGKMFASVQRGKGEAVVADGRFYAYYDEPEFVRLVEGVGLIVSESWTSEDGQRPNINWINVLAVAR